MPAVRLHFPAPWLIGSMLGVAALQVGAGALIGYDLIPYWPAQANIASQVFLGATIGSKMNKQMFVGLKNTLIVAVVSSAGLIAATVLSSIAIAEITGISVITAILAFSCWRYCRDGNNSGHTSRGFYLCCGCTSRQNYSRHCNAATVFPVLTSCLGKKAA